MINKKFKYKLYGRLRGRKKVNLNFLNNFENFKFHIKNKIYRSDYNVLDIGSGSGENAIFIAKEKPYSTIITCELFQDGNINLFNHSSTVNFESKIAIYSGYKILLFYVKSD